MNHPDNNSPTNSSSKEVEPVLKECPFCGRKSLIEEFRDGDDPQPLFVATCQVCPVKTYDQFSAQEAATVWNIRTPTDSAGAMVDGISWAALLTALERLRSKNRNPDNEWYHGWNAAIQCLINDINARAAAPSAPKEAEEAPIRREVKSSRHPHFTAADHERMKETLDSLSDYPTEEEAEAVLQACGTSGKEVVNEFIERLLKENSELKARLAAKPSGAAREAAEEIHNWMFSPPDSWPVRGEASIAQLVAIISRHFPAAAESVRQEEPHPGYDCGGTCVVHGGLASDCDPDG